LTGLVKGIINLKPPRETKSYTEEAKAQIDLIMNKDGEGHK